jgi:hypothetical protein
MFDRLLSRHLARVLSASTLPALALMGCADADKDTQVTTATGVTTRVGATASGTTTATGATTGTGTGGTLTGGTTTTATGATTGTGTGGTLTGGTTTTGTTTGGTTTGGTSTGTYPTTSNTAAACDPTQLSYPDQLILGFQTVPVGTPCPDAMTAVLDSTICCPEMTWAGVACSFSHVQSNYVFHPNGYTGSWAPAGPAGGMDVCWYEGVFTAGGTCCGRPLLAAGQPVMANAKPGASSWNAGMPVLGHVDKTIAILAGEHWLRAALMEHASIASFARFALELVQFGAPADLLHAALVSAKEEVDHAERCFALASAYLGTPVGPTPVDLTAAAAPSETLADFAEAVVREGCVGEAMAAIEAAARLSVATEPAARELLSQIMADESTHAALAWRTLRWVLEIDPDGSVRERVRQTFANEADRWLDEAPMHALTTDARRDHGLIEQHELRNVLADGWKNAIAPAWSELD